MLIAIHIFIGVIVFFILTKKYPNYAIDKYGSVPTEIVLLVISAILWEASVPIILLWGTLEFLYNKFNKTNKQ